MKVLKDGVEVTEQIGQTYTLLERSQRASQCTASLHLSLPTVVDREDNKVNRVYAGWPDRFVIVGKGGEIAYIGGPGPWGFKPQEVEKWLKENTN